MSETPANGFRVVLTADRSLMADYRTVFEGMVGAGQTTSVPSVLMRVLVAPPVPSTGLRAVRAPLGLRRLEAALLDDGLPADHLAVVTPERLPRAVGTRTRIVGLSSGDPLGLGMNTSTMTGLTGGRSRTMVLFQRLLADVRRLKRSHPDVKIVVGGPGAWQLAQDPQAAERLGVDHVLTGYCETDAPRLFRDLLDGAALPRVCHCTWSAGDVIPPIRRPSVMGVVEITRGCGLGCDYCTLAHVPMTRLTPDAVLRDVRTNLSGDVRDVALMSEDVFRYGGGATHPDPAALLGLLRDLRDLPGIRMIQPLHANISSVSGFSDDELAETARLFRGDHASRHVWVNVGVETASGQLLRAVGGRAKMHPFAVDDWGDACHHQVRRLVRAGFTPMISLLTGLPGETPDDVETTCEWVRDLDGERVLVFPVFLAPIEPRIRPFGLADMTPGHWRLFQAAYRFNFRWNLKMLRQEHRCAGAPWMRRAAAALFGPLYLLGLKTLFALES